MRPPAVATGVLVQVMGTVALAQDCGQLPTQLAMNQCAATAFAKTDAALNAVYRDITARLADDAAGKQRLTLAQRGWLAFRDADCAFVAAPTAGGSIQAMVRSNCLDDLTQARLAQLQAWLDCQEGDVTCPVPVWTP